MSGGDIQYDSDGTMRFESFMCQGCFWGACVYQVHSGGVLGGDLRLRISGRFRNKCSPRSLDVNGDALCIREDVLLDGDGDLGQWVIS